MCDLTPAHMARESLDEPASLATRGFLPILNPHRSERSAERPAKKDLEFCGGDCVPLLEFATQPW
jgi:hypothetical protein